MSRPCAACGRPDAHNAIGGTLVCAECRPELMERIEAARTAGKTPDASREARAMLRESAQTYILRDIPAELWQEAKHASVDRGLSLRDLLLAGLRKEIAK